MWIREAEYREQPDIHYKHALILQMRGSSPESNFVWSTFPNYNFLAQDSLRVPAIKVRFLLPDFCMPASLPVHPACRVIVHPAAIPQRYMPHRL